MLLIFLFLERLAVSRNARRIPLRIAVTGTRGKSTVTRFIAAALREAGFSVLAKTTGSKPVIILPNGREEEIRRRGSPSLIEGKKILKRCVRLRIRALVAEMMSIQPECLRVESQRILQPHILVVTNVRVDHREEMGRTRPEISRGLASAFPVKAAVFLLDEESRPEFQEAAVRVKADVVRVGGESSEKDLAQASRLASCFGENLRLALAVAEHLGIPREVAARGIAKAEPDFGSLKVWQADLGVPAAGWVLASAFAANDPESTAIVLDRLRQRLSSPGQRLIGIVNFRPDRGDRTRQWLEAGEAGFFSGFHKVYFVGAHVQTLRIRRLLKSSAHFVALSADSPGAVMEDVTMGENGRTLLVGMGNMGGLGAALVEYWEKEGRRCEL